MTLLLNGDGTYLPCAGEKEFSADEECGSEEGKASGLLSPVHRQVQLLSTSQKIKMALTGDKEWRTVLIKDTVKPVCCAVLKNPRITEAEIISIIRSSVQFDDIIRIISGNREWLNKYQIRKALVENHRTPLHVALKLLATLPDKDLSSLAKSRNVSSVIATQARKMLIAKK